MKTVISCLFMVMALMFTAYPHAAPENRDQFVLKVGYFDFTGLTYADENGVEFYETAIH